MIQPLKIHSALICEDARRDEQGKVMLIGVLAGGAQHRNAFPATLDRLFLYISGVAALKSFKFEYRLCEKGKSTALSGGKAELTYEGEEGGDELPLDLVLRLGPATFPNNGTYFAQIRFEGGNWKKVAEIHLISSGG